MEEQKRKEMALIQACKENAAAKEAARIKEKSQYRPSSAMQNIFGDKKIEEEYSLYDQPDEDDKEDELLESIMEDIVAEDEDEKDFRENMKEINQQIQEKQNKLEETQSQIDSLSISRPLDFEEKENTEEEGATENKSSEDDEELEQLWGGDDEEDDEEEEEHDKVYKAFEDNKTLVKLGDKIKNLKHR